MAKELKKLLAGFRQFRERYFEPENSVYRKLAREGQSPKTLVIGCSDSRVDPTLLSAASPGELFVVRNVANLVPPYEKGGGLHGVSAAIEFAVVNLKVENIVVLGHRQCGGIRALVEIDDSTPRNFVTEWVKIAMPARKKIFSTHPHATGDSLTTLCELESIKVSLINLQTFPFVQSAIAQGRLRLVGAYFDLESGDLLELDQDTGEFEAIDLSQLKSSTEEELNTHQT